MSAAELEPRSRRDRPAKLPLSRAAIVQAGLDLVASEGLQAVTLRRVAALLDTGPASLYVYVAGRDDLLARMLDEVLAQVAPSTTDPARWRVQLTDLYEAILAALDRYPGIADAGLGSIPSGSGALAIAESTLGLLRAGGASDQAAAWAVDALTLFTMATAAEHAIERRRPATVPEHKSPDVDYQSATRERLRALAPDRYPNLHELAETMTHGDDVERFRFALGALIAGAAR